MAGGQDQSSAPAVKFQGPNPLDPTRNVANPRLESSLHSPLPEQYIWTVETAQLTGKDAYSSPALREKIEPHYFLRSFRVTLAPKEATLYLVGPRSVKVWMNGQKVLGVESDTSTPLGSHVFATAVAKLLRRGENVIAIEAVRGKGSDGIANNPLMRQELFGEVLAAKILPAAQGVNRGVPLLLSDEEWRSTSNQPPADWTGGGPDTEQWPKVLSIGGIESSIDLFQWNADGGLYDWPGYEGISPFLAHLDLPAVALLATYASRGEFSNLDALTRPGAGEFSVRLPAALLTDSEAPSIYLDFGRELSGRIAIVSDSDTPAIVTIQTGESEGETQNQPYLGVNQLTIAPHATGYGPKGAFRYAKLRFLGGGTELSFKSIHVDHIYYPVRYRGSFESSDALLNRIWEVGAYTAHLCMQDGIWDAPKRDRGRWMGDTDVSGRVIDDVFGDRMLMQETLDRLIGPAPVSAHVNGIPGYSAFWITGLADYYRHTGAKDFLASEHDRLVQLLSYIDGEFDEHGLYANRTNVWPFVDWSPDLNGDTSEARRATTLEFGRSYRDGAWLLRELGDTENADKFQARAEAVHAAAQKYLLDPSTGTFGLRWQTNSAAVIGGAASPDQYPAIWKNVLSSIGHPKDSDLIMTPYYGDYVLRAMAEIGHRREALDWIRQFWGGMLAEGATSFWESYDTRWYKDDFHASLQGDNGTGYFISLAHGWSAGPTDWLMEQVLGIEPTGAGFSTVSIRPDLLDLDWARGGEPTPDGLLRVDLTKAARGMSLDLDLPEGVVANVSMPASKGQTQVMLDGQPVDGIPAESGTRLVVTVRSAGPHSFESK
jgi:alpha-L-rhamnosidase